MDDEPALVVILPTPYSVEPRENEFEIVIDRPRRR
jgi:hypothetical protein